MSSLEAVKSEIKKTETVGLQALIQKSVIELGKALPSHLSPERLVRIALTCIRLNPELSKCTPESFLGSLFVLAQIGIEPVAGRAYILPFNNKKKIGNEWKTVKEAQAIIGYKGLAELFYRHESALSLDMQTVHENDDFSFQYGTESYLKHKPAMVDRGAVIGYYAVAKMKGGASVFRFMSKQDAMEHGKKHSKTWITKEWNEKTKRMEECAPHWKESSPWAKEPDSMCMKTILISLSKLIPMSVELQRAIAVDETSREYRSGIDNALDLPDTTSWSDPVETTATETTKTEDIPFGK